MNWTPNKGVYSDGTTIDIELASGDGVPVGRFIRYPNKELGRKVDMWVLFDNVTGTQWFLRQAKAEARIQEVLDSEQTRND